MAGFLVNVGKAGEVAERSPAVISANLKEDMLLQKKIVILNRSERSVVHQVKVDQKVLYKRFQSRLVRSKLAFARIMGHKDTEQQLRSKNLGGLNTDIVGSTDEEYSFLDKLEHRPCTASSFTPRVSSATRRRGGSGRKEGQGDKSVDAEQLEKAMRDERPSSAQARLEAIDENGTHYVYGESQERGATMRPATTMGLRLSSNALLQNRLKRREMSPIQESVELKSIPASSKATPRSIENGEDDASLASKSTANGDERGDKPDADGDDNAAGENKTQTVAFVDDLDVTDIRPPKCTGDVQNSEESPPITPRQLSRRASKAADFFQEEKKIDLVGLRLKEAKSKDYTERVQTFCEEIEEIVSQESKPSVDYYASRLEAADASRQEMPLTTVPGTPEDENKRCVGNIFVRSLTVPAINLDY